jgi:hypothetical protein
VDPLRWGFFRMMNKLANGIGWTRKHLPTPVGVSPTCRAAAAGSVGLAKHTPLRWGFLRATSSCFRRRSNSQTPPHSGGGFSARGCCPWHESTTSQTPPHSGGGFSARGCCPWHESTTSQTPSHSGGGFSARGCCPWHESTTSQTPSHSGGGFSNDAVVSNVSANGLANTSPLWWGFLQPVPILCPTPVGVFALA